MCAAAENILRDEAVCVPDATHGLAAALALVVVGEVEVISAPPLVQRGHLLLEEQPPLFLLGRLAVVPLPYQQRSFGEDSLPAAEVARGDHA